MSEKPDPKRRASPTFGTGGGGTRYEHLVGGWLAAALLAGAMPLGREFGAVSEIRLQGEASGWVLDDLVVSGEGAGRPRWSASVKSHSMLTGAKLEERFVESAWAELLGGNFEAGRDRIGLVCGSAAGRAWKSLLELVKACAADPEGTAGRIKVPGAFNEDARSLWDSAKCPAALVKDHEVDLDASPERLLAALIPLRVDLLEPTSRALPEAIEWCRQALIPEKAKDADDLWDALCALVAELGPSGGVLDVSTIGARLGPRFAIRNRADFAPDWELIARHTQESLATVRNQIGKDLRLPRKEAWAELSASTDEATVTLLSGPSGCGKSALARRWLEVGPRSALWLSGTDLGDGLAGFARKLSLQRSLPDLLVASAEPARIVIDGLDRSHDSEQFAAAARLAQLATESEGKVALLITAQEMEMPRVSERLRVTNAPASRLTVISDLDDEDVRLAQSAEPRLAEISVAGQLHSLFRRPKLVDLFLSAGQSGPAAPSDEAGLARLWWQSIVSSGPESAPRQALVLKLASKQADGMVAATMSDELSPADVASVDNLRRDGVLASDGARYEFAHDLFVDWALLHRLEALEDRAITELGAKVELPTWHRAIRLYALTVLREQGIAAWSARREQLEREDQWLLAELFLDAALFAHDSAAVVRSLWSTLIANKGNLLRRLLRRLRFSASVPDPTGGLIFAGAPEMETYWAIQRRVPLWPIWIPFLEVLHEERAIALELADAEVAPVVETWLRFAGSDAKGSDLAAEIALECGRFVREQSEAGVFFEGKLEKSLWSAALSAGAVDPAAVIEMFISALRSDEEREVSRFGGWNRVDRERVRETVLEADLSPLISADPRGAAKLIEAAVWDDTPREGAPWDMDDPGPSITEAPNWHVAVPERGPFLRLLIEDPDTGLDCVVSLAERATKRWAEAQRTYTAEQAEYAGNPDAFGVLIDGQRRQLLGDAELLAWHRGTGGEPKVLACALMAAESYLYKQLDKDEDIAPLLKRLIASDSVAVWGVLTEAARYRPELMWGQLQPLFSSPGLLMADRIATLGPRNLLSFLGFIDKVHTERAQKWAEMPHRKLPLTELLIRDAFQDPGAAEKLAGAREIWREEDEEHWKHLIAQLDPANRKLQRYEDGSFILDYEPPTELRGEIKEANTEITSSQIRLGLPGKLRKWIDERSEPSPEELESFWGESQKAIAQPADQHLLSQGVIAKADLECGVAALFVTCAREWLRSHPEREDWCRRALLAPFEGEPPATHEFDSAEQLSSDSWDGFCADALPLLWAESPQDPELRAGVARLAIHLHLETVQRTFRATAGDSHLALGLAELEHLSLHWARFKLWHRARAHATKYEASENAELFAKLPDFEPTTRDALNSFVAGTLGPPPRLRDWLAETPDGVMIARQARRQPVLHSLSLSYLIAARVHLVTSEGTAYDPQRAEFAADLANSLIGKLVPDGVDRIEGTPYTEERNALDLLARLTLEVSDEAAEAIWQPILEAGEPARYWVEAYLGELWSAGLLEERLTTKLVSVVKRILDCASKTWTRTGRGGDDLALKVAGVDTVHHSLWSEQRQSVLTALEPQWSEWVKPRLTGTWFARYFAHFLEAPAAMAVRAQALSWLADAERNREHTDSDLDEATAELLVVVYAQEAELISGAGASAEAARYLLSRLAGRGIPLALELSARLG